MNCPKCHNELVADTWCRRCQVCPAAKPGITYNLTIPLTDAEHQKLYALASARGISKIACIKRFIDSCQPGGSGYRPPWVTPSV